MIVLPEVSEGAVPVKGMNAGRGLGWEAGLPKGLELAKRGGMVVRVHGKDLESFFSGVWFGPLES